MKVSTVRDTEVVKIISDTLIQSFYEILQEGCDLQVGYDRESNSMCLKGSTKAHTYYSGGCKIVAERRIYRQLQTKNPFDLGYLFAEILVFCKELTGCEVIKTSEGKSYCVSNTAKCLDIRVERTKDFREDLKPCNNIGELIEKTVDFEERVTLEYLRVVREQLGFVVQEYQAMVEKGIIQPKKLLTDYLEGQYELNIDTDK